MKISKEVKVGLFMVTAIVLLYLGFNFLKGIDFFSSTTRYYAVYKNVNNLTESNQIYLNGYAVGRVRKIHIQQSKNRVVVEMNIDSEIILNDSTEAVLNGELLGGRFIQLVVGNSKHRLQARDTVRSDMAKGLMDLITENAQPVASNLQTTLAKLNTLLDGLSSNSKQLDSMFSRLQKTPVLLNKTLTTASNNIETLGSTYKGVAENLNNRITELKPTLSNFNTLSDSLKALKLNGTLKNMQVTLGKLNETLSKLNKGDNTMSKLLTEDTLYVNLNKMLVSFDSLANHINHNPKHFLGPLGQSHKKIEKELQEQKAEQEKKKK
ncbi:MAG TPA: MlaD family protein [Cyclobacteriaceae bacterium]|jgi:phospholipid/cholesterol/gamma-HCH transport system substrate-binding protein|nr:MlaD family protein [Cyclobacteriaceae bacterium]